MTPFTSLDRGLKSTSMGWMLLCCFISLETSFSFTPNNNIPSKIITNSQWKSTQLHVIKQTRSSLLNPPKPKSKTEKSNEEEANEEIFGTKFFGGSAIKEELFDAEAEAQADKLMKLYPRKTTALLDKIDVTEESKEDSSTYNRFMDQNAFPHEEARAIAQRLQSSINYALYDSDDISESNIYSSNLQWNTPFSKDAKSRSPLDELENALDFYKRIDVAIVAAKNLSVSGNTNVQQMEVRWEMSLLWPNAFESSVLITGTSTITVDLQSSTILSQTDKLDNGGKEGKDIIKSIFSQIQPRFWDLYHVGMTPSAQMMPHVEPSSKGKGILSSYELFEIPPRLVLQPTIVDSGGRDTREGESLPNHAFASTIKTTGPTAQRYVTTSPVEVSIRRSTDGDGVSKSIISWGIPLPPEYVSNYSELSKLLLDEDKAEGNDPTNGYVYQPRRLVATMKYGGNAQDVEVTEIRKKLYEQVIKDGLKPKLGEGGRPEFFFLSNDTKACFTGDGGLGMVVYEWRPKSANTNEVGIDLEL